MILISVDFPAPLSPIKPTISLRPTAKSTCDSACTRPKVMSTRSRRTMWWNAFASRTGVAGRECGICRILAARHRTWVDGACHADQFKVSALAGHRALHDVGEAALALGGHGVDLVPDADQLAAGREREHGERVDHEHEREPDAGHADPAARAERQHAEPEQGAERLLDVGEQLALREGAGLAADQGASVGGA